VEAARCDAPRGSSATREDRSRTTRTQRRRSARAGTARPPRLVAEIGSRVVLARRPLPLARRVLSAHRDWRSTSRASQRAWRAAPSGTPGH
jgi:hypothetical protein